MPAEHRLDRTDPRPLYAQLHAVLAAQIAGHTLLPGDALPTEAELVQGYGVARSVVRQALAELVADGSVHRGRGRGTVVATPRGYRRAIGRAGGLGAQFAAAGHDLRTELLDVRRAAPPAEVRAEIDEAPVWVIERLRRVDGVAAVLVRTWLPVDLLPDLDGEGGAGALADVALHDLLRARGHVPVGGLRHVRAVPADPWVAEHLGVAPGTPVLLLEGVTRDGGGRGLEWFSGWHHPSTVFDVDAVVSGEPIRASDPVPPGPAPSGPKDTSAAMDTAATLRRARGLADDLASTLRALGD